MSIYIKHYNWLSDKSIIFELNTGEILNYHYKKYNYEDKHYLQYDEDLNNTLIRKLGIKNPYEWAENILGYRLCDTGWPEAKSKEDLLKLIDALCKYNNPEFTPTLPSEIKSFYNEDKTEVTFKELDVTYHLNLRLTTMWWRPKNCSDKTEEYIFTQLKIKDKNKWVEDIQGYKPTGGTGTFSFPESKTKEDAYKVMNALIAEYIKQFQPKTTIKTNSYGDSKIELRRKKADVRVGSCPAGSIVYGKRSKASVRSRRVSYQTCIGN